VNLLLKNIGCFIKKHQKTFMTIPPIKPCLSLRRASGLRSAAAWLLAGLVLAAGIAGCGGGGSTDSSSSSNGSNGSGNGSAGGGSNTVPKRFDYPNVLDASFGNNGTVSVNTGFPDTVQPRGFYTRDFIVDRLGRIVVLGIRTSAAVSEVWIYRMLADGTPDPTCGIGGWGSFTLPPYGYGSGPQKIVQHPDGPYILGVVSSSRFAAGVAAVTESCSLDRSFGIDGIATVPASAVMANSSTVNALAVDSSGRILAAFDGGGSGRLLVSRFLPSGAADLSFGLSGVAAVTPTDGTSGVGAYAIAVRPDGRILIATQGYSNSTIGYSAGFAQLLSTGAIDASFGTIGFVSVKPASNLLATPKSMVLLADGSAIQGGLTKPEMLIEDGSLVDAYWLKVDASGRPDTRFGNSGLLIWNAGPQGTNGQNNVEAMTVFGPDGDQFANCQDWMNSSAPPLLGIETTPSEQSIVQWRATATGELLTQYADGGTGWLPRDNDPTSEQKNHCIGLRVGNDSKLLALLELGAVNKASTPMFAVARIK